MVSFKTNVWGDKSFRLLASKLGVTPQRLETAMEAENLLAIYMY